MCVFGFKILPFIEISSCCEADCPISAFSPLTNTCPSRIRSSAFLLE